MKVGALLVLASMGPTPVGGYIIQPSLHQNPEGRATFMFIANKPKKNVDFYFFSVIGIESGGNYGL